MWIQKDSEEGVVMEITTRSYETPNGQVEGVVVKWSSFSILMVTGPKGFLACPAIDIDACEGYGKAAAVVESSAENPIGTLERFCERRITKANACAKALGIKEGMVAEDAFGLIS
jgi:uncharacterized protein YunC (DUF1805 family)